VVGISRFAPVLANLFLKFQRRSESVVNCLILHISDESLLTFLYANCMVTSYCIAVVHVT